VEGAAFGIGLGLAIAGDLTVAANNARFCAAQIRRGLCPDGMMYYTMAARCDSDSVILDSSPFACAMRIRPDSDTRSALTS